MVNPVDKLFDFFRRIGVTIDRHIRKCFRVNCYTVIDRTFVKHNGFRPEERACAEDIQDWSVDSDMSYDTIYLLLKNGKSLEWRDYDGYLLQGLRDLASEKERSIEDWRVSEMK